MWESVENGQYDYRGLKITINLMEWGRLEFYSVNAATNGMNIVDVKYSKDHISWLTADKCNLPPFDDSSAHSSLDSAYFRMHDNFKGRIYFRIMLKESNQDYTFWLMDQLHGQQLWSAAVNGQFADVQFLVGERTFHVHQVVAAARSP